MPAFLLPLAAGAVAGGVNLATGLAGRTKVSESDRNRLAELRRLEELGALGLTDAELAVMRDRRLSPINAASQEAIMRSRSLQQAGEMGTGGFYAGQIAMGAEAQQQRQTAMRDVQAADVARASQQREEAQALSKSIEQQEDARRRETMAAIAGAADSVAQAGFGAAAGQPPLLPALPAAQGGTGGYTPEQIEEIRDLYTRYGQE